MDVYAIFDVYSMFIGCYVLVIVVVFYLFVYKY